jgi:hypothetical protein
MTSKGYPRCQRCGYCYDPKKNKRVITFFGKRGEIYTACEDCIAELGEAETEKEKEAIIQSCKMKAN